MKAKIFNTKHFCDDGRGPSITKWLYYQDLCLPGAERTNNLPGLIKGAEYGFGWVIFYKMQVIQIVPEEVYSYWHLGYFDKEGEESTGVWYIEDSEWLKSFNPRHLAGYQHFVLVFYDDIIEVICKDLIFGKNKFNLKKVVKKDIRFMDAYIYRGDTYESKGLSKKALEKSCDLDLHLLDCPFNIVSSKKTLNKAIKDFEQYLKINPEGEKVDYALRSIEWIQKLLAHK